MYTSEEVSSVIGVSIDIIGMIMISPPIYNAYI